MKRLTCSSSSSSSSSRCCVSSAEESLFTSSGNPSASERACVRLSLSRSLVARSLTRVYGLLRDARRSERIIARSRTERVPSGRRVLRDCALELEQHRRGTERGVTSPRRGDNHYSARASDRFALRHAPFPPLSTDDSCFRTF